MSIESKPRPKRAPNAPENSKDSQADPNRLPLRAILTWLDETIARRKAHQILVELGLEEKKTNKIQKLVTKALSLIVPADNNGVIEHKDHPRQVEREILNYSQRNGEIKIGNPGLWGRVAQILSQKGVTYEVKIPSPTGLTIGTEDYLYPTFKATRDNAPPGQTATRSTDNLTKAA